jgi:hypothetical protein
MNLQSPIYITAVMSDGRFMLGGMFKMQDQVGFPIDASFEECKTKGCLVDWLEALADCWLNDCLKFDSFVRQSENLCRENLKEKFKEVGAVILAKFPKIKTTKNPVDVVCRYILAMKKLRRFKL